MNKLVLFFTLTFSSLLLVACDKKEKEKVGYEKVIYNKYQWNDLLFHFTEPDTCFYMTVSSNGTIDPQTRLQADYMVQGDSIFINRNSYIGVIKSDRLILKDAGTSVVREYLKIN